jgi:hypothetical protein
MNVVIAIAAWSTCAALLVLTVACQRPKWQWLRNLKYHDVVSFIPAWTFFAPRPGTTDTRVLWRDCLRDGTVSPWRELLPPSAGLVRAVWNPLKRQTKLLTDVGPMVVRMAMANPDSELTLISLPYLIMLHRVMAIEASPLVEARQFLVVQTTGTGVGEDTLRPLFASRWHALASSDALTASSPRASRDNARTRPVAATSARP